MEQAVKLVSITSPLVITDQKNLSPEELIVYIARVSNPSNQLNTKTSDKLIKYLITHKHWSPFEHAHMTVEIKTSRAIAAQILRHRSFSFQEFSQRYATANDYMSYTMRERSDNNRQSSETYIGHRNVCVGSGFIKNNLTKFNFLNLPISKPVKWLLEKCLIKFFKNVTINSLYNVSCKLSLIFYNIMIDNGVAPECARNILPLSTSTTMYMTGSIRSWLHYIEIRADEHTQFEHRQIAQEIEKILQINFPNVWLSYQNNTKDKKNETQN
jgi:thymidylate synthase (FAD)